LAAFSGFAWFFLVVVVAGVMVAMAGASAESIASASFPVGRISVEGFLDGICAPLAGGVMIF
jgi:hypothetical protein